MKNRRKKLLILEVICFVFCLSIFANQNTFIKKDKQYTPLLQDTELSKSMIRGSEIYSDFCMQCHLPDGKGTAGIIPPLANSDWLISKRKESISAIKYGLNGPIEVNKQPYNGAMSSLGLEDEEIADVMNYIMNSWGNTQEKIVTVEEVYGISNE